MFVPCQPVELSTQNAEETVAVVGCISSFFHLYLRFLRVRLFIYRCADELKTARCVLIIIQMFPRLVQVTIAVLEYSYTVFRKKNLSFYASNFSEK